MEKDGFSPENRVRLWYIVRDLCPPPQYHYMAGGEVGGYALESLDELLRFKLGRLTLAAGNNGLGDIVKHFILSEPEPHLLDLIDLLPVARGEGAARENDQSVFGNRTSVDGQVVQQTIDIMNSFLQEIGSPARFANNRTFHRDLFEVEDVGPRATLPKLSELQRDVTSILADDKVVSLIVIDLDGFKAVNDSLGHDRGDLCLDAVVDVVGEAIAFKGRLYRFREGDEFAVVLRNTTSDEARATAERICAAIEQKKVGGNVLVTASIGVASSKEDGFKTIDNLLKGADDAMYVSKYTTKNCVTVQPVAPDIFGSDPGTAEQGYWKVVCIIHRPNRHIESMRCVGHPAVRAVVRAESLCHLTRIEWAARPSRE